MYYDQQRRFNGEKSSMWDRPTFPIFLGDPTIVHWQWQLITFLENSNPADTPSDILHNAVRYFRVEAASKGNFFPMFRQRCSQLLRCPKTHHHGHRILDSEKASCDAGETSERNFFRTQLPIERLEHNCIMNLEYNYCVQQCQVRRSGPWKPQNSYAKSFWEKFWFPTNRAISQNNNRIIIQGQRSWNRWRNWSRVSSLFAVFPLLSLRLFHHLWT